MQKLVNALSLLTLIFLMTSCNKETTVIEAPQVYCRIHKFDDYAFIYQKDGFISTMQKFRNQLPYFYYTEGKLTQIDLGIYGNEKFFYDGDALKRIEVSDKYKGQFNIDVTCNESNQIVELKGQGAEDYITFKSYTTKITYNEFGSVDSVITFNETDSVYTARKYAQYDGKNNPLGEIKGWPINVLGENSQYVFFNFPFDDINGSPGEVRTLTDTLAVIKTLKDSTSFWARTKLEYEYAGAGFQVACIDSANKQIVYECRYEDCPK